MEKIAQSNALRELIRQMMSMMKKKAPDPSPEHEAMETPEEEKTEHDTGMEIQDEPTAECDEGDEVKKNLRSFINGSPKKKVGASITVVQSKKLPQKMRK